VREESAIVTLFDDGRITRLYSSTFALLMKVSELPVSTRALQICPLRVSETVALEEPTVEQNIGAKVGEPM